MRIGSILRARKDMIDLLLRNGRLGDIQMLNFFSLQLERERVSGAAAATTATAASSQAATSTAESPEATRDEAGATKLTETQQALETVRMAKQAVLTAFEERQKSVKACACVEGATAWTGEVYGTQRWSTSYLSRNTLTAVPVAAGGAKVKISGMAVAVGGVKSTPTSVQVIARLNTANGSEANDDSHCVVAVMPLGQPGVTSKMVNGFLQLELAGAEATIEPLLSASEVATHQHVLSASAFSGILTKLEEICALHATSAVHYDALAISNPAVQMRLSQLACFRFGVDALISYVVGDTEVEENDDLFRPALDIPLVESMVLNMYAESAVMDGFDCALEMVRDTPLVEGRPHRSRAEKRIDYPYIHDLYYAPKYALTSMDGSMEQQALEFLSPLLKSSNLHSTAGGMATLYNLLGMSSGRVRLTAPHVNLKVAAIHLERDVSKLLEMIGQQSDKEDPTFIVAVGQYVSEVFANLAAIYRCTASLTTDEDGKGHREWLLAQTFCASSRMRREKILSDFSMSRAASKILRKAADLDNYSTHPVELMNAAAAKFSNNSGSGETKAQKA